MRKGSFQLLHKAQIIAILNGFIRAYKDRPEIVEMLESLKRIFEEA